MQGTPWQGVVPQAFFLPLQPLFLTVLMTDEDFFPPSRLPRLLIAGQFQAQQEAKKGGGDKLNFKKRKIKTQERGKDSERDLAWLCSTPLPQAFLSPLCLSNVSCQCL